VNFRSQSISVGLLPIVRRDLRHACQVNRVFAWTISAPDYRRMVRLPGLADDFVPEFPLPSDARTRFWRSRHYRSPPSSRDLREDRVRLTLTNPHDLRHAPDCELVAVNDRTLSQSARPAHPFGLLVAYSIAGTLESLQSLFPARLQLAASLRRQLRQPGCDSKFPTCACAQTRHFRPQC
jgi:hypothetical protein